MPLNEKQRGYLLDELRELDRMGKNLYSLGEEKNLESSFIRQYVSRISQSVQILDEARLLSEGENREELTKAKEYLNGVINSLKLAAQYADLERNEEVGKNLQHAGRQIQYAKNRLYEGAELRKDMGTSVRTKGGKVVMGVLAILATTFLFSSFSFPNLTGKTIAIESIPLDLVSFSIGIATLLILGYQITKK
jgi:hypothetical protein